VLGNYAPQATSTVINYICATPQTGCAVTSSTTYAAAPPTDFFGNFRKTDNRVDAGAVEFGATGAGQGAAITSIAPTSGMRGTTVAVTITGTNLNGATAVAMALPTGVTGTNGVTCTISGTPTATTVNANCTIVGTGSTPATLGSRNVTVTTPLGPATLNNGFTVTANAFAGPTPALTSFPANTTTKTGTITFTNPGPTAFVIAAAPTITKVGTAGGAFSITGGTCVNGLSVGTTAGTNTCTITVQYAPGTSTATATANVSLNGGTSGTLTSANFTAN